MQFFNPLNLIFREFDPWGSAGVSSIHRPGGPMASTDQLPIFVVRNATHNADLSRAGGLANPGLQEIQNKTMELMRKWVGEFYSKKLSGAAEVNPNAGQRITFGQNSLMATLVGIFSFAFIVL